MVCITNKYYTHTHTNKTTNNNNNSVNTNPRVIIRPVYEPQKAGLLDGVRREADGWLAHGAQHAGRVAGVRHFADTRSSECINSVELCFGVVNLMCKCLTKNK